MAVHSVLPHPRGTILLASSTSRRRTPCFICLRVGCLRRTSLVLLPLFRAPYSLENCINPFAMSMRSLLLGSVVHRSIQLRLPSHQRNSISSLPSLIIFKMPQVWYCCECDMGPHMVDLYYHCTNCGVAVCSACSTEEIPDKTSASIGEGAPTYQHTIQASKQSQYNVFGVLARKEKPSHSPPLLFGRKSTANVFAGPRNWCSSTVTCCQCEQFALGSLGEMCAFCPHVYCSECDYEK
jgi:hypothetical protein